MKRFKLKADCEFDAEDVDDALLKLGEHFLHISKGERSDFISNGEVELTPKNRIKNG